MHKHCVWTETSFEYEKVVITTSGDANPNEIFEKVTRFDKFLSGIIIPKTTVYSQQKGHVFITELEELSAYFGSMSFHRWEITAQANQIFVILL